MGSSSSWSWHVDLPLVGPQRCRIIRVLGPQRCRIIRVLGPQRCRIIRVLGPQRCRIIRVLGLGLIAWSILKGLVADLVWVRFWFGLGELLHAMTSDLDEFLKLGGEGASQSQ
jgi:hypothetical protein